MTRAALLQLCSSDDPIANLATTTAMVHEAAKGGATFILTPEVTNCVSGSRARQEAVLCHEEEDPTLAGLCATSAELGVWILIGSLALKTNDPDGRFANRSFLINPSGQIVARYDKIHMFDVTVSQTETYRESAGYRPGEDAVLARTPFGNIGMTICYDIRFPHLYRQLAQAGAEILTIPAAFSPVTGAAHWEPLMRARAIETGCYVLAPAQTGHHLSKTEAKRKTYGHSIAVSPWGEVLVTAGTEPCVSYVDIDRQTVAQARGRIPSSLLSQRFNPPQ